METHAPSPARILIALGFAVSCFGLALFLWIAFGGPVPLKAESYRFTAYFPEAAQLAAESDVRIGGVSVGKVKTTELAPLDRRVNGKDTTAAEIEIQSQFAPISVDSRAILRAKTLLGETYIELTPGTARHGDQAAPVSLGANALTSDADADAVARAEPLEDRGELAVARTTEATQIDEIFNALDEETRMSFRRWQAGAAEGIQNRGLDLSDALGNLGPFVTDASRLVEILEQQQEALQGTIRDTGRTFDALTERGEELAHAITGSRNTFEALASEEQALAETFSILPTFSRESRALMERVDRFQVEANPMLEELIPVARELSPTLRSVRRLAPHLRDMFHDLEELEHVSLEGLPALRDVLEGLAPVLRALDPFLANLNPALRYLEYQKRTVTDFLTGPASALSGTVAGMPNDPAPRHYLRQLSVLGTESLSIHPNRLPTNRGNAYLADGALNDYRTLRSGIWPNFDCRNTNYSPVVGGDQDEREIRVGESVDGVNSGNPPDPMFAPCWTEGAFPESRFGDFGGGRNPRLFADP